MTDHQRRSGFVDSARMPNIGDILTIVSGKGGVGKTNLALNLGIQLSRQGRRVILVDADFGLANADILLNVSPLADVSDLLDESHPIHELLVDGPEGLRVLCGISGPGSDGTPGAVDPERCTSAVRRLAETCDTLIVDCGAGVNPVVEAFAKTGDLLLLTTTPEPTALADAYATLKLLQKAGALGDVGVIVNMVRAEWQAEEVFARLRDVAARFLGLELEYLGYVSRDRHVLSAVQDRVPVTVRFPRCATSTCINVISKRFLPPAPPTLLARGLWSRVASLFL